MLENYNHPKIFCYDQSSKKLRGVSFSLNILDALGIKNAQTKQYNIVKCTVSSKTQNPLGGRCLFFG